MLAKQIFQLRVPPSHPGHAASRSGEISREYKKRLHETENDEFAKNSVKIFATENHISKGLSLPECFN